MNRQLRLIREKKALSRKDLAGSSGVNESTIYRAECGQTKLRPSTVRKLAQALNIEIDELTSRQGTLGI
jgi:transcriptional regulator with XRE-family HTH domain